jgi:hypothetical protein
MNIYDIATKDFILSNLTEEDIFHRYLGIVPKLNEFYTNPVREDHQPDCRFYRSKNTGMLKFKDFAMKWDWDCFNVVQFRYNCSFKKALIIIAKDFGLFKGVADKELAGMYIPDKVRPKVIVEYRVKRGEFRKSDYDFWNRFGIDDITLKKYNVLPAKKVWMIRNGIQELASTYSRQQPCYMYHFGGYNYKFYYPTRTFARFIHANVNIIQGYQQLPAEGEYLVITKSLKDVMCMDGFGIPAIAPMSETITDAIDAKMPELRKRFKRIFVLMDWDRTGQVYSLHMRKVWNAEILSFKSRQPKDFSDHYEEYGMQYMIDLIEDTKQQLYL